MIARKMMRGCFEALRKFWELVPEFRAPDTCLGMGYLLDTVHFYLGELRAIGFDDLEPELVELEQAIARAERKRDELMDELADEIWSELRSSRDRVRFSSAKT